MVWLMGDPNIAKAPNVMVYWYGFSRRFPQLRRKVEIDDTRLHTERCRQVAPPVAASDAARSSSWSNQWINVVKPSNWDAWISGFPLGYMGSLTWGSPRKKCWFSCRSWPVFTPMVVHNYPDQPAFNTRINHGLTIIRANREIDYGYRLLWPWCLQVVDVYTYACPWLSWLFPANPLGS